MDLEGTILACKETGDFMPVWEQLVNTPLFVSVLTKDQGPQTNDFIFEVKISQQDSQYYIFVSDKITNLAQAGRTTAIREVGHKLLNMVRPGAGVIVVLSGEDYFCIPPGLLDWIRESTQPVASQNGS